MSYDVMVFDPAAPPSDRVGFLAWYSDIARWGDGKLSSNPSNAGSALQAWYRDMIKGFPAINGPDASDLTDPEDVNRAEYRFSRSAVFAAFQWENSRHALRKASRLARIHNVGFFDVSGETAAVWAPNVKGFYAMVHRNE